MSRLVPTILVGLLALSVRAADNIECQRKQMCNGSMCADVCEIGTVVVDPWVDQALAYQRSLQYNFSLLIYEMPGTHNGAIAQAYSFGIEEDDLEAILEPVFPRQSEVVIGNQRISLTDQLNIGVRHMEVDIHRIGATGDRIRICHWPVCPIPFPFYVVFAANQQDIELDWVCQELGCTPNKPLYEEILSEVVAWLEQPENRREIVILYLDNKNVNDLFIDEFLEETNRIIGSYLFTPADKAAEFPNSWPSIRQLVESNRRVIIENNRDSWANDTRTAPVLFTPPIWDSQFGPSSFSPYPDCLVSGRPWYDSRIVRSLDGSLTLGPAKLWEGRKEYTPEDIVNMVDCSVNIQSLDQIEPETMQYFVWSWERDQPNNSLGECATMQASGRWRSASCTANFFHVCVNPSDLLDVVLSVQRGANSAVTCPSGYVYGLPQSGLANRIARSLVPSGEQLYLNLNGVL